MELEVVHKTLIHEQVVGSMASEVPPNLVETASGQLLINFQAPAVPPIQGWAPDVCQASQMQLAAAARDLQASCGWQHQQRM